MGDVIITVLGLWVFIKTLKATTSETGKIQPTECSL